MTPLEIHCYCDAAFIFNKGGEIPILALTDIADSSRICVVWLRAFRAVKIPVELKVFDQGGRQIS